MPDNVRIHCNHAIFMFNTILIKNFLFFLSAGSPMSPQMSPSSPFQPGQQFFFPRHMMQASPSTSTFSSPRQSFRVPRRRLNSHGSYAQQSDAEDEEETPMHNEFAEWENHYQHREQLEEFSGRVPQPKKRKTQSNQRSSQKPKSEQTPNKGKITSFVISALQYVIDTLR